MKEMTLIEHLTELRKTVVRVVIILILAFALCYSQSNIISEFLMEPLRQAFLKLGEGKFESHHLLDKVLAQFQIALWSGVILSSPLWFREIWAFLKPALYEHEIKVIRPFIWLSFLFFCLGVLFGYFIVFPYTFETLLSFGVEGIGTALNIKTFLVLAVKVLVFLGLMFQLPNLMLILGFMGLATKQSLRGMRPYVFTGFAILSALLTPPDPVTLMALWLPLVCLFEVGILGVAIFVHPYLAKKHAP